MQAIRARNWLRMSINPLDSVAQIAGSAAHGLAAEAYRIRRDRPVPEQLALAAGYEIAKLDHAHDLQHDQAEWEAKLRVAEQAEIARINALRSGSLFGHLSDQEVHDWLVRSSNGRKRPVLLLAPLWDIGRSVQENTDRPDGYYLKLRSWWQESSWSSDMDTQAGIIKRPLFQIDQDISRCNELLSDLPVILVHGFTGMDDGIRLEIHAWSIAGAVHGSSPGNSGFRHALSDPPARDASRSDRFLTASMTWCAVLAEWFYVGHGQLPRRHREIAEPLRAATAAGSLAALSLAVCNGSIDSLKADIHRAILLCDIGEHDELSRTVRNVVQDVADADPSVVEEYLRLLRDSTSLADDLHQLIDAAYDRAFDALIKRQLYGH
jgi:hypothetical protein